MKLADLQNIFQQGLLGGAETGAGESKEAPLAILDEVNTSQKEEKEILFGVYQTAYVLRLIEFLQGDYESLEIYLGDEGFDQMARAYIASNPSVHPNARWFGSRLASFLAQQHPWAKLPQLAELAAFENALLSSFDGEDAAIFGAEEMARIEDWAGLTLTPHPTVERLRFKTNVADIREALLQDQPPPEMALLAEPQHWIFYRNTDLQSMYRMLSYEEAMVWDEMAKGVNFAGLCEILATYSNEEEAPAQAAGYLQGWIADGLLKA